MKEWPEDGSTVRFEDLSDPLRKLVDHFYELKCLPKKEVPYNGYDCYNLGDKELVGCWSVMDTLSIEGICYHEERGRDPMKVILSLAVQVGIEQGRRAYREEHSKDIDLLKLLAEQLERITKEM